MPLFSYCFLGFCAGNKLMFLLKTKLLCPMRQVIWTSRGWGRLLHDCNLHPYVVNSHRLLVRGHRVPYDENDEINEALNSTVGPFTNYAMWIFRSLAVVALFAVVVMKRSRDCQQLERLRTILLHKQKRLNTGLVFSLSIK